MTHREIERAQSALRDLAGLIPEKDRHWAEDEIAVLEKMIFKYGQMAGNVEQAKLWIGRALEEK